MRPCLVMVAAVASCVGLSCKTPVELAGEYSGAGTENVSLSGEGEGKTFDRAPLDERVTVRRGAGRDLHIKYGSCDLPARTNPDGVSATLVYGKCWVSGFPGPIPVEGTFNTDPTGTALTVLITGALPAPAGTVSYAYKFSGKRVSGAPPP